MRPRHRGRMPGKSRCNAPPRVRKMTAPCTLNRPLLAERSAPSKGHYMPAYHARQQNTVGVYRTVQAQARARRATFCPPHAVMLMRLWRSYQPPMYLVVSPSSPPSVSSRRARYAGYMLRTHSKHSALDRVAKYGSTIRSVSTM